MSDSKTFKRRKVFLSEALRKNKFFSGAASFVLSVCVFVIRRIFLMKKADNEKVAVIVMRKLGDAVFTIPAIKALRKHCKENMVLICFEETKPIYKIVFEDLDIITAGHDAFYFSDRLPKKSLIKTVAGLDAGVVIDLTGVITSAAMLLFTRAKKIIGSNEDYFYPLYTKFIPAKKYSHLTEGYLEVVRNFLAYPEAEPDEEPEPELSSLGIILIHPFAGWRAKEWNLDKYISLAAELNEEYDCRIIAPSGTISQEVSGELIKNNLKYTLTTTVEELISEIKKSSLFISNDSGPLHIAALLGKPTFTIFGPTDPSMHIPLGKNHRYVRKEITCSPKPGEKFCFTNAGRNGCPSFECMNQLSFDEVLGSVERFVASLGLTKKISK